MFSSSSSRVVGHQSQENRDALVARKPGITTSARKPLGDRATNESNSLKPESSKPKVLNKASLPTKKASPKKVKYPDWIMEACSFEDVEDTYEDIWPKSQRLNKYDFINMVNPKTPPLKETFEINPMFLELPQENYFNFDHEILLEKEPIEDVEFPDFDSF